MALTINTQEILLRAGSAGGASARELAQQLEGIKPGEQVPVQLAELVVQSLPYGQEVPVGDEGKRVTAEGLLKSLAVQTVLFKTGPSTYEVRELFNREKLLGRTGDEESLKDLLLELIPAFKSECREELPRLHDAIASSDADKVRSLAHTLKGAAQVFCADQTVDLAFQLEAKGRSCDLVGAQQIYQRIEREINLLIPALEAYCESLAGESK